MSRRVIRPHLPERPNLAEEIEKYAKRKEAERGKPEQEAEKEEEEQSPDTEHVFDIRGLPEIVTRNPRDYIRVPRHNIVIAREKGYRGKNWRETLGALARDGLLMPRIDHFMTHFLNVRDAVKDTRKPLFYADGTFVSEDDTLKLWSYISSPNRGNMGVCWTWLDAMFKKTGDKFHIETDHRIGKQPNVYDLRRRASKGWVDLKFNKQGLPTRQSWRNYYFQGENIYFLQPRKDRVAGFYADLGRASLRCDWDPDDRVDSLGAFACAENFSLGNTGGSK